MWCVTVRSIECLENPNHLNGVFQPVGTLIVARARTIGDFVSEIGGFPERFPV